ncbi:MAG: 2Fe-2S iron-sulfur cluster binding domain-containing protein [Anaerolineales bacterium]|nr:2Fe-2S iron-sulfur cluster binding domain-containing protein [Anaerolineales bacterium]
MSPLIPVRFEPQGITVMVSPGVDLLEAARRAGIRVDSVCNGQGVCGECCIEIIEGVVSPLTLDEEEVEASCELGQNLRLACRARVVSATRVRVVHPFAS